MLASAERSPREIADSILSTQACGNRGCACARAARVGHGLTHCPHHQDNGPSLNVDVKGDRLLVHCHAAGTAQQAELIEELKQHGWWPEKAKPIKAREIVGTYDYLDRDGAMRYQALRYFPKGFSQRRPDGKGGWAWNLDGVERLPYRLPELLEANPKRLVFIVEGEKDVDRLYDNGCIATCNSEGAGKWHSEFAEYLQGRSVVVVVDNDTSGLSHSRTVVKSLDGVAGRIVWLTFPEGHKGYDISDFFDDGNTANDLKARVLAAGAPPVESTDDLVGGAHYRREGDEYRYEFRDDGITAVFSEVRKSETGPIRAFLTLASSRPDHEPGRRWVTRVDVTTQSQRKETCSKLGDWHVRDAKEWANDIDAIFQDCMARQNELPEGEDLADGDLGDNLALEHQFKPIVLHGQVNMFLADQQSTKSYLLMYFAACTAGGIHSIWGEPSVQGTVVIFDWESDSRPQKIRLARICRGLGIERTRGIHYYNMSAKGSIVENARAMRQIVAKHKAVLVILDSLSFGSGGDINSAETSGPTMVAIGSLGDGVTKLVTAHPTKASRNANPEHDVSAIGSGLFEFRTRSIWRMLAPKREGRGDSFVVSMTDRKQSESSTVPEQFYRITFDNERYTTVLESASAASQAESIRTTLAGKERVYEFLASRGQADTGRIAAALNIEANSVRAYCSQLQKAERIVKIGGSDDGGNTTAVWSVRASVLTAPSTEIEPTGTDLPW